MWFHRINRLNISGCCLTTGPLQPATGEMCRASAGLAISLKKPPEMDRNHGNTWTGIPWVTEETGETNNRTSMRSNKFIRSINHQHISTISTKNIVNYRICNKSSIKSSFFVLLKFILSPVSTFFGVQDTRRSDSKTWHMTWILVIIVLRRLERFEGIKLLEKNPDFSVGFCWCGILLLGKLGKESLIFKPRTQVFPWF